jgi:acetyltransferase-like isoleucine patch superfamily enzyme
MNILIWFYKIRNKINTLKYEYYLKLRYPNLIMGKNSLIFGKLLISIDHESDVRLGDNIIFRSATKYNFVGINKPVSIAVNKNAELSIGDNCGFSGTSIYVSQKLVIGKYCNFGGNTAIWDTDFHPLEFKARRFYEVSKIFTSPIVIGNDVFVGANSIILKGVTIGDRAIIGAGSIVTKDIPKDEVWAGNPAKFIRKIKLEIK